MFVVYSRKKEATFPSLTKTKGGQNGNFVLHVETFKSQTRRVVGTPPKITIRKMQTILLVRMPLYKREKIREGFSETSTSVRRLFVFG